MSSRLLWTASVLVLVFAVLQIARPKLRNPPVTADLQVPADVKQVLKNSCYDCHSNETNLRWFDNIIPAYWKVRSDVRRGRRHLNFSEIGTQPEAKQKGILYEAVNQIQLGAMPLSSYTLVHQGAVVAPEQLAVLRAYLSPPPQTAADPSDADVQYAQWIVGADRRDKVPVALNGIPFMPDYKNWREVSTTDRFDNQTMRVILGNEVALKAIAGNHINPWPDGTAFAKIAWKQEPDGHGFVKTGAFVQVEFMIRDSQKYSATKNWGFARFLGADLKPYGKNVAFADDCVGCHTPVSKNDYVYTMPIKGQQ